MTEPLVSVIVPAYNVASYIAEALDCVFAQSFQEIEAIVVNDASPDGAALESVLAGYSDPRLRYLAKPNGGPASARNIGIAAARGRWVAFLDGDDVWQPNYLGSQLELLSREPSAAAAFPDGFIFGDTPLNGQRVSSAIHRLGAVTLEEVVVGRSNLNYCCVAKREALERIGGFDESLKHSEDHDMYLRLLLAGEQIVVNPEPLFRYRRRGDSLSADWVEMARSALLVYEKLEPQFAGHPGLSRLAEERRNVLRAMIEFALGREALRERRWRAAPEHWRAHQRLRPSWKVAAALEISRISPRLVLALMNLNRQTPAAYYVRGLTIEPCSPKLESCVNHWATGFAPHAAHARNRESTCDSCSRRLHRSLKSLRSSRRAALEGAACGPCPGGSRRVRRCGVEMQAAYYVQDFEIVGRPEWVKSDGYAIALWIHVPTSHVGSVRRGSPGCETHIRGVCEGPLIEEVPCSHAR